MVAAFLGNYGKALAVTTALFVTGGSAQAQQKPSVVVVNPTAMPVIYQIKWGADEWKTFKVLPGKEDRHWFNPIAGAKAPTPTVRFDYICNDTNVDYKEYSLEVNMVLDPIDGRAYFFRLDPTGTRLDLFNDVK